MKKLIKIEPEYNPQLQGLGNEIRDLNNAILDEYVKKLNKVLEEFVRQNAHPPIKGEITKGKVKWRGLRWCNCFGTGETWVEQRGVQITPRITFQNIYLYEL